MGFISFTTNWKYIHTKNLFKYQMWIVCWSIQWFAYLLCFHSYASNYIGWWVVAFMFLNSIPTSNGPQNNKVSMFMFDSRLLARALALFAFLFSCLMFRFFAITFFFLFISLLRRSLFLAKIISSPIRFCYNIFLSKLISVCQSFWMFWRTV